MRTAILTLIPLLAACQIHLDHIDRSESFSIAEQVDRVEIDSSAGDVSSTVGEDGEVRITRLISAVHEPELSAEVHGGVLRLEAHCDSLLGGCSVDHELVLPPGVDLVVITGAGDIHLEGLSSRLDLETGAGDVSGTGLGSSSLLAQTGAGDISLDLVATPADVALETGAGDVSLGLPGGEYECDLYSGAGDVAISGISCEDQAFSGLYVHAGAGDLSIRGD